MSAVSPAISPSPSSIDDTALFEPASAWTRAREFTPSDEQQARRAREGVAVLRTRLSGPSWSPAVLERVFWLDPYAIEIMVEDAQQAVPGTHLEVQLDASTPAAVLARVRARLTGLQLRGIAVDVRRTRRAV